MDSRPRILQVVGTSLAIPYQVLPFAEGGERYGYDVHVASPEGSQVEMLLLKGFRHFPIRLKRSLFTISHLQTACQLRKLITSGRYDIIHFHGPITGMIGRVAAVGTSARTVYHCRGGTFFGETVDIPGSRFISWLYPRLERILSKVTDKVFTLNPFDAADFVEQANYSMKQVICLGVGGAGVDVNRWSRERMALERTHEFRAIQAIPEDKVVIGFAGRIVREKGILDLLEAFRIVRQARGDVALLLIGNTPSSERDKWTQHDFRQRVDRYGLSDDVYEVGHMDDPRPAFMSMDILCLPSYREGFGQVIAEAGALGVPAVASITRGTRQAIIDGVTGILVPKANPARLADALLVLIDDPRRREALGRAAKDRVFKEFREEVIVKRVVDIYDGLLNNCETVSERRTAFANTSNEVI